MRQHHRLTATLLCVAQFGGVAAAQFGRGRGGRPRLASDADFDGRFNFCRLMYISVLREEGGAGWWTDYPGADQNFSIRLSELTKTAGTKHHDRSSSSTHLASNESSSPAAASRRVMTSRMRSAPDL
jgi:hypothetical protein